MKTLGSRYRPRVWLGAKLSSPGTVRGLWTADCPLFGLEDSSQVLPFAQHTLETEEETDSDKTGAKGKEAEHKGERWRGRKEVGLNLGLQTVLNCRRGRKQLRVLGPWGLTGEDRTQPHAESFSPVGGCLRKSVATGKPW